MATPRKTTVVPQILIALGLTLIVIVGMSMARASASSLMEIDQQITYETHDVATIQDFRSEFVGDNSNTVQLLYALPLGPRIDRVEIHETGVDVFLTDAPDVDPLAERNDVLYSSIALFAAVDNATSITYFTSSDGYSVSRWPIEERFGWPLSDLLDSDEAWQRVRTLIPIESRSLVTTPEG